MHHVIYTTNESIIFIVKRGSGEKEFCPAGDMNSVHKNVFYKYNIK